MAKKKTTEPTKVDNSERNIIIKSKKYNDLLEQLDSKCEHHVHTDDELKEIAKDLYHNKIFSNLHIDARNSVSLASVFMPLMFMGGVNWGTDETRESKIIRLLLEDKEAGYNERHNAWVNEIGFIYEYYGKEAPRCINGMPMFYSCHLLSKTDAKRMLEFHDRYKELQDNINSQF